MSPFRATIMAAGASVTFLGISALLLLTPTHAEEKPGRPSQPSLTVTPPSSVTFSGPQGGPFSPSLIEYRISASTGTVSYSIRTPSWLTASPTHGVADTSGVTVTFNVSASASALRPGTYGPVIVFTSGRGSTVRFVRLIVQGPSLRRPADQVERGSGGYLLDDSGICWTTVVTACLRSEVSQAYTGAASARAAFALQKLRRLPNSI